MAPPTVGGAFGVAGAVDEFDDRHWRHVTIAEASLQNADIATLTLGIAWAEHVKEFLNMHVLLEPCSRLAAGVQITALGECNQLFHDRTQFFRLGQRGFDLFVFDERTSHVGKQRLAVLMGAVQAAVASCVTHFRSPILCPLRAILLCLVADACQPLSLGRSGPGIGCVIARTHRG